MATLMATPMAQIMDGRAEFNPWQELTLTNHGFCPSWAHGID
jgi:hypothetical protein